MARTRSRTTAPTTAIERSADAPPPGLSLGAKLGIGAGITALLAGAAFLLWPSSANAAPTPSTSRGGASINGSPIVAEVQSGLVKARIVSKGRVFDSGDVTGVLNDVTEQAIRAYQARYGLPDTGQVSDALRSDMVSRRFIASATPSPSPSR